MTTDSMAIKGAETCPPDEEKDARTTVSSREQGGWITFPYIIGSLTALSLAFSGASSNFLVYLIQRYNVKSIDAAQITNIVNGCSSLAPLLGAIVSDSYFGCFAVVAVSTAVSLLSMLLFTLTAVIPSLSPIPCAPGAADTCEVATAAQLAVLYAAVALMCVAVGGTRFTSAAMGAGQFDSAREQDIFFNWFFVAWYTSSVVGATVLVYMEDSVSWSSGFGACAAASAAAVVLLLMGTRHYRRSRPTGSPLRGLAQVAVAAVRKWRWREAAGGGGEQVEYYHGPVGVRSPRPPTGSLRCLNRAAVKTTGDTKEDGSVAKPWRLCTVAQVEDLKTVLRILPLWSTSIFLSVSIGIQLTLTVLQALTVDRSLGAHFTVPAGSLPVSSLAATALALPLLDRRFFPAWRRLTGEDPTPLQRVGVGHVLNAAGMAASALVERRRIHAVRSRRPAGLPPGAAVPMSVLWLLPPLAVVGVGEAMHFPGQVALYYREFPAALRSSATGMIALIVALGFYLSTAVVDLVRRVTDWLPDDVNASKLDRVYWLLAVGGMLNFGAYLICARFYEYQRVTDSKEMSGEETHLGPS